MTVYFIGAGPGDPELLTRKAERVIGECPVCLYAGSLVPQHTLPRGGRACITATVCLRRICAQSAGLVVSGNTFSLA